MYCYQEKREESSQAATATVSATKALHAAVPAALLAYFPRFPAHIAPSSVPLFCTPVLLVRVLLTLGPPSGLYLHVPQTHIMEGGPLLVSACHA